MSEFDAALTIFTQEVEELLRDMEDALLSLETAPKDAETINRLFRAMHTIKGSSGLFGFNAIVGFTHAVESVLDKLRNGERLIDAELISVLLDCKDHTSKLVDHCLMHPDDDLSDELAAIGNGLIDQLSPKMETAIQTSSIEIPPLQSEGGGELSVDDNWLISLEFSRDTFRDGLDPLSFISYLTNLGEIKQILTLLPDMPTGEAMDPESCYLQFKIAFHSDASKQAIEAVFEFVADDCDIKILPPNSKVDEYLQLLDAHDETQLNRLGDMLVQIGALTQNDLNRALQSQLSGYAASQDRSNKPLGEILLEQQVVQQPVIELALKKQEETKQKLAVEANYIRVDATKLGHLIDLVGELVISSAAMSLIVERHNLSDAGDVAASMNALVSGIRDTALELRMVQIGETFSRFRRVVRDVSKELNKDIELYISGGETELDKTVVEKINDPLTHLIRNALDHGIEHPEQRVAAGKPAQGSVHLNAYHQSGHIVIQISDDGAGINTEKIVSKAKTIGLLKPDQELSLQEAHDLIFVAGLSTKEMATNLSGRGVGMDVVKKNIEALRGSVNIDSVEGQGTTISIELPLTLAIIDGFMVATDNERYIIPLSMVDECIEMDPHECEIDEMERYINLRGQVLPYLRLGDYFNSRQTHHTIKKRESMVVVKFGQIKAGFVVDELHGEHQTVIKPLGKVFENLKGITGATVLGDGNVALILDVQGLIQVAIKNKTRSTPLLTAQRS